MNNFDVVWDQVLAFLAEKLTNVAFNTWIKPMTVDAIIGNNIYFLVSSEPAKNIIDFKYKEMVKNCINDISGVNYDVTISLTPVGNQPTVKREDVQVSNFLIPKYTFDNFIVGASNRFAHAAALAVAEAPAIAYNPLFIYGGVGLGKTHLMHAVGNLAHSQNPQLNIVYINAESLTNQFIDALRDKTLKDFKKKFRSVDVLLVDDVQFIAGKDAVEEEFFHTFNELHQANKQICLTSDRPPKEIQKLTDRLRNRFEWGLIADIQSPDYETRVAILKKKTQILNVEVSDDILMFIADKIKSNIRELEGVFTRIVAYRGLIDNEITIDRAMEALRDYETNTVIAQITPDTIVAAVSRYYGLMPEALISKKRTKELAEARHVAMYICREVINMTYPKIGDYFNRNHATVMHAFDKVDSKIQDDSELLQSIEQLINDLRSNVQ